MEDILPKLRNSDSQTGSSEKHFRSWRNSSCVPRTALSRHRDCYAFLSGDSALQGGLLLKKCIDIDKRLMFDQKKEK